jgi:hypothetical protein
MAALEAEKRGWSELEKAKARIPSAEPPLSPLYENPRVTAVDFKSLTASF